MAFNRIVKINVGTTTKAVSLDNLHCEFDIKKTGDLTKNSCVLTVFNASEDTINNYLSEGNIIEVYGGYEDEGLNLLFVGNITQAYTRTDLKTATKITETQSLMLAGKYNNSLYAMVDLSYPKGNPLDIIVQDIADGLGFTTYNIKKLKSVLIPTAFAYSGYAHTALKKLDKILGELDYKMATDNNTILVQSITPKGTIEGVYLTPKTGLLEYKRNPDKTKKIKGSKAKKTYKTFTFTSLLNGTLTIGKIVKLKTKTFQSLGRVDNVQHKGANYGKKDFISKCNAEIVE